MYVIYYCIMLAVSTTRNAKLGQISSQSKPSSSRRVRGGKEDDRDEEWRNSHAPRRARYASVQSMLDYKEDHSYDGVGCKGGDK